MNLKKIITICVFGLLVGCTTDDGKFFNGGHVGFPEPKQVGENHFLVFANGAGANTKEDVIEAFHWKAKKLCKCSEYESEIKVEPYRYSSSGGGFIFFHDAWRAVGSVKWENTGNNAVK